MSFVRGAPIVRPRTDAGVAPIVTVIEPMTHGDVPLVHALATRAFDDPWTEAQLHEELDRPHARCLVLREGHEILGYAVVWLVADEVEILHIAVDPARQRRGLGRLLVDHVLASAASARLACLDVRASNAPAIALYTSAGFTRTGLRRRYYAHSGEDAVLMQRELANEAPAP